jgi:hypothetical protein
MDSTVNHTMWHKVKHDGTTVAHMEWSILYSPSRCDKFRFVEKPSTPFNFDIEMQLQPNECVSHASSIPTPRTLANSVYYSLADASIRGTFPQAHCPAAQAQSSQVQVADPQPPRLTRTIVWIILVGSRFLRGLFVDVEREEILMVRWRIGRSIDC